MSARTSQAARLLADAEESARSAGLRHVDDSSPGLRRVEAGPTRFRYLDPSGAEVSDPTTLDRIDAFRIPPAWTDVWICRDARGHLQATGRDARGRKQYRYHPRWRDVRDATKFEKILDFAAVLPRVRARVTADLARSDLSRERVLATAVRLLDSTLIRVGNDEYARENASYGLTTLERRHVEIHGDEVAFHFRGKSGKERWLSVRDPRIARVVRRCVDLPGQVLLKYRDQSGEVHAIHSHDVNDYLRDAAGDDFTAKDFRTWAATVLAGLALRRVSTGVDAPRSVDKQVASAIKAVAEVLGNTPAVCRKCYVHPLVLEAHREGTLIGAIERALERRARHPAEHGLRPEERAVLAFLRARLRDPSDEGALALAPGRRSAPRGRVPSVADATRRRERGAPARARSERQATGRAPPSGSRAGRMAATRAARVDR